MPAVIGMKEGGFYNQHSSLQLQAMLATVPWLKEAIPQLPAAQKVEALGWIDIGCSQGGNTLVLLEELLPTLRAHVDGPVWLNLSDLPSNDYNALFQNLFAGQAASLTKQRIYPSAIAGNAYERLVPAGSMQLVTTFNALQYQNKPPGTKLSQHYISIHDVPTRDFAPIPEEDLEPYRQQARQDIVDFYRSRAKELQPGGKLLVQVCGSDEQADTFANHFDAANDAMLSLIEEGVLPRSYHDNLHIGAYTRTPDELVAPLAEEEDLRSLYRVDHVEAFHTGNPLYDKWKQDGDTAAYARDYTAFHRAFGEPLLAAGMSEELKAQDMLDRIFTRYEELIRSDLERYRVHYVATAAMLTRL